MAIGNDPAAIALATDTQGVDALRLKARTDPKGAVKETARQFEALLMNVMLKSMRETVAQDGMFDNEQTRLYTSMLDQQLSQSMAKRGIGLAEVLARQLMPAAQAATTDAAAKPGVLPPSLQGAPPSAAPAQHPARMSLDAKSRARLFIERLAPDAETVSRDSGIPVRFLLGHAVLESGWGRSEIRAADGTPTHNLFGIKAGAGWTGRTVDSQTTEYAGGVAQKKVETFRAYNSYQDSLRDYAKLLASGPRYAEVVKNTNDARAYARELQDAGYATDPRYADKLAGVIDGKFLRLSKLA
jgi:flagellar protein FlgJ